MASPFIELYDAMAFFSHKLQTKNFYFYIVASFWVSFMEMKIHKNCNYRISPLPPSFLYNIQKNMILMCDELIQVTNQNNYRWLLEKWPVNVHIRIYRIKSLAPEWHYRSCSSPQSHLPVALRAMSKHTWQIVRYTRINGISGGACLWIKMNGHMCDVRAVPVVFISPWIYI